MARTKNIKEYNISDLIKDTMESLVLTQIEYAEHLKCTQQSISTWLNSVRYPGQEKMAIILKLAKVAQLDLETYRYGAESEEVRADLSPYPRDVRELIKSLLDLHTNSRKKRLQVLTACLEIETMVSLSSKRVP